ncbi:hypothetical protein ACHAWF_011647 [Thalassiosira exigua]
MVGYLHACNIQDQDGSTPLHLACDTTCRLFEEDEDYRVPPRGPPELTTVKILLQGSLGAVILEDLDEMSPIEYAILSDAPLIVIKLLQKASRRVLEKKNKKTQVTTPPLTRQTSVIEVPRT